MFPGEGTAPSGRTGSIATIVATLALLTLASVLPARSEAPKPKFGPAAVPITEDRAYLRQREAPDFWALVPHYVPQISDSACSLASIAMLINALRGVPTDAEDTLATQAEILDRVDRPEWRRATSDGGSGITFEELAEFLELALAQFGMTSARIEIFRPGDASPETFSRLRRLLRESEASREDVLLAYFNQGILTGDWDGPHVSPIGAYDAERNRVLIMDVDRRWYVPYWSSDTKLLEAMLRPAPAEQGKLAGETGGLIRVSIQRR